MLSMGGLRGSKQPNPPAMTMTGAVIFVSLLVITIKLPVSLLIIVSARSPSVKPGLKVLFVLKGWSPGHPPIFSGNPGYHKLAF